MRKVVKKVVKNIKLDGLSISLFRGDDGMLVVDIDSTSVSEKDSFYNGVPKLRVWINEQKIEILEDGTLKEE